MSLQPGLSFSTGRFEIGTWGSYSISPEGAGANEHDLWIGYTLSQGRLGRLSAGVTDYYFPSPGAKGFFSVEGSGKGAHWIEPVLSWSGTESFPLQVSGSVLIHNDPDRSAFVQIDWPLATDGVELDLSVGAVTGKSTFYSTDGFRIIQSGIRVSKSIMFTNEFALPISLSYILNPLTERTFLVFGISLQD